MPTGGAEPSLSRWRSYRAVDSATAPDRLSRQLDGIASVPAVAEQKRRSLELLELGQGASVLDVGCGNGAELPSLARTVGASGRVVGVDLSAALIGIAEERGLARLPSVELVAGDAAALPFEAGQFDACRADRTLQHLADPDGALAEMARVTRHGGRIAVTESRWGLVAPGLDREVTGQILERMANGTERTSSLADRLPPLFERADVLHVRLLSVDLTLDEFDQLARFVGLDDAVKDVVSSATVSPEQADGWCGSLRDLVARGEAFVVVRFLHAVGSKP